MACGHQIQQAVLGSSSFVQLYEMKIVLFSSYSNLVLLCDTINVCIVIRSVYIMYDAVIHMIRFDYGK
jgi:hypothetical protein